MSEPLHAPPSVRVARPGPAGCLAAAALAGFTIVSVDQEIAVGREANAQLRAHTPVLRDGQVNAYVARIGQRLAKVAPGARYPYTFAVADYREINAFSLPGGPVWINRGVLRAATNESQVASVLAHEIAHIAERHAADRLTETLLAKWSLTVLGAMLGNVGGSDTARIAGAFMANGAFLAFSRDDERAADRVGLQIMMRAGWDPRGMVELLDTLRREQARDPSAVERFLSTHPSPQDRIAEIAGDLRSHRGGVHDTSAFRSAKARLLRMPPARAMPAT